MEISTDKQIKMIKSKYVSKYIMIFLTATNCNFSILSVKSTLCSHTQERKNMLHLFNGRISSNLWTF